MPNSTFRIVVLAALAQALDGATALAEGPYIQRVDLAGTANLTGANFGSNSDADANSTLGFVATHSRTEAEGGGLFQLSMAVGFGAKAADTTIASRDDYVTFLQSPQSTLGVNLELLDLWTLRNSSFQVGFSAHFRAFGNKFKYSWKDPMTHEAEDKSQPIGLMIAEPSVAVQLSLYPKRDISAMLQLGITTRFWNKPHESFAEALGSSEPMRGHAYFGPRASLAIYAGHFYGGVELTRLWGAEGDSQLRQFAVLPFVGIIGGLTIKSDEPKPDKTDNSSDQGADDKDEGKPVPTEQPSDSRSYLPTMR